MMKLLSATLDFFIPRFCPSCNNKLKLKEEVICAECFSSIAPADDNRLKEEFRRKFSDAGIISGFKSLFVFEKEAALQHVIHSLKYDKRFGTGIFLGKLLGEKLKPEQNEWSIDYIVPIPLHHLKKAERGFNQSTYIAKGMKKILHIPVKPGVVKRVRYTQSQTGFDLKQRRENISKAFIAKHKNLIEQKTFLLVDDVITTGATISECGKVLLDAGAKKVYACSVAIAD